MVVHSKPAQDSLPYNCYELYHTWQPDCCMAATDLAFHAVTVGMSLNAPLYLISQIYRRKFDFQSFLNTFQSTCRSSIFLGCNTFGLLFFSCLVSKLNGRVFKHTTYLTSAIASFFAILIERGSRRRTLTLYVANVATDTLFRMAVSRGKLKPIPGGEVYLFSLTMALFLYSARKCGFAKDYVSQGIRYIVGNDEVKSPREDDISGPALVKTKLALNTEIITSGTFLSWTAALSKFWKEVKHHSCPHHDSCLHYVALGFLRPFLLGCAAYGTVNSFRLSSAVLKNPANFFRLLIKKSFNFGLFLSGFTATFRFLSCCLRWLLGKDREIYAIPAAFVGGLFMKFFPSSTIALNLMWNLIDLAYLLGIKKGILPEINGALVILYAVFSGVLVHAAVLEPHNLKPSFVKFLDRVTDKKLKEFNRHAFDHFGCHSSKIYPNFFPKLDPKFTSTAFKENHLLHR